MQLSNRDQRYWKSNLRIVSILLAVWLAVGCGLAILGVEPLNRIRLGGFPLGFWIAQQGAIYVFILLILIYAVLMDRLDDRYDAESERG